MATEEEGFLGQPRSCCRDSSPGSTLLVLRWAEGKVPGKIRAWEQLLCPALSPAFQSFLPSFVWSVLHSSIMKVEHVLNMSVGLGAAWRRSKLQHCLDKSASYQVQHHIIVTSSSRPSSVSLRWGLALEIRHQRWHVHRVLGLEQMLRLTLMFHPALWRLKVETKRALSEAGG